MSSDSEVSQPKNKVVILRRIPLFSSCNEKELLLIAERTRLIEHKKGETIYREGDAADAFYIIISGRLRVVTHAGGVEKTLTILHNDDSFGEISLLTGEAHSATVQAVNDTLVLRLGKIDFDDVINRVPSLVLHLSRLLSRRLRTQYMGGLSEATIVSVYSAAPAVGCTMFATALAGSLQRETAQETVLIDFSGDLSNAPWLYPGRLDRPELAPEAAGAEDSIAAALVPHQLGFQVLPASALLRAEGGDALIAPMLSLLIKRFKYVLMDLPVTVNAPVLKALTQSDGIYVVTDADTQHVHETKRLMHQLQSEVGTAEPVFKIVLSQPRRARDQGGLLSTLFERVEDVAAPVLTPPEVATELGQAIDIALPYISSSGGQVGLADLRTLLDQHASPYGSVVRRVARELGGKLIGLALGSGAALGLAHIGVLKVLEREKIPIDMIAGSSIGAMVGGLWASGQSAEDLERMALRFRKKWDIQKLFLLDVGLPVISLVLGVCVGAVAWWCAGALVGVLLGLNIMVISGLVLGPLSGGPIQGAQLMKKLQVDFAGKTFEETWLPLKVVAANPVDREEVVFQSGSIAEAVRASVSIPGIFKPVKIGNKIYLDGGVVNPIPVSVLRRAGARHVIAVNVFPTTPELRAQRERVIRHREEREARLARRSFPVRLYAWLRLELRRSMSPLIFDVIMRSMQAMEYQIAEVSCQEADVTLRPTVPSSHWLEFFNPEKFIRRGEEATLQALPQLRRLAGLEPAPVDKGQLLP